MQVRLFLFFSPLLRCSCLNSIFYLTAIWYQLIINRIKWPFLPNKNRELKRIKESEKRNRGRRSIVADIYTRNCSFVSVNCISFKELVSFNDYTACRTSQPTEQSNRDRGVHSRNIIGRARISWIEKENERFELISFLFFLFSFLFWKGIVSQSNSKTDELI